MRRALTPLVLSLSVLATSTAVAAKPVRSDYVYGPAPTWPRYRELAEAEIRRGLKDPDSARIEWAGGYHQGSYKAFLTPRVGGYIACGTVNARNSMGGYAGRSGFAVVIDYDRVVYLDIAPRPGGMIEAQCAQGVREGLFPPLPANERADVPGNGAPLAASSNPTSGLTLRAMPDGAYISAVATGSPAAEAGLKPGMVIASVNAIPLTGMGEAMLKVVDAAGGSAVLTVVGGTSVTLGPKR